MGGCDMLTRIIVSVVLAPLFLAVLLLAPAGIVALMVAGIVTLAAHELLQATGAGKRFVLRHTTGICAAVVPGCYWLGTEHWSVKLVLMVLLCILFLTAVLTYGKEDSVRAEDVLFCLMGGMLYPVLMSSLVQLRMMEKGPFLVMLPIVSAFLTDTGAYFFGMFLGKHRGIVPVSPKKSAEGFIGGLLSGVLFMLGYGLVMSRGFGLEVNMLRLALYGFVGSFVTMLGDLSFSLIKRQHGIKDYGSLIPGHGGMLDRFDSMSFAAPTMWLLVTLFPAL